MNSLSISFFSLNLGMSVSLLRLLDMIKSFKFVVICLQEVKLTSEQIEHQLPAFRAVSNIDLNNPSKPGTAIVWSETLPVHDVSNFTSCRLQFASLGPLRFFNISEKKYDN